MTVADEALIWNFVVSVALVIMSVSAIVLSRVDRSGVTTITLPLIGLLVLSFTLAVASARGVGFEHELTSIVALVLRGLGLALAVSINILEIKRIRKVRRARR